MMRSIFFALLCLILSSCAPHPGRHHEFVRYHDTGEPKPIVTVVPIWDRSQHSLDWDISEEIREGILRHLAAGGEVFVPKDELLANDQRIHYDNWSMGDFSFAKNFESADFVVFVELIDHQEEPYKKREVQPLYPANGDVSEVLKLAVKLQVMDVRGSSPKVVLQEVLHSNHMMPKSPSGMEIDYRQVAWGEVGYGNTPIGQAHSRLERDAARQVEQYIRYASQRIR